MQLGGTAALVPPYNFILCRIAWNKKTDGAPTLSFYPGRVEQAQRFHHDPVTQLSIFLRE